MSAHPRLRVNLLSDDQRLDLVAEGYQPYRQRMDVPALGEGALAALKLGVYQMQQGGYISEHDAKIAGKLARIMTGGDLSHRSVVTEQYLLDLEREAFVDLWKTENTQKMAENIMTTGKPLFL